MAKFYGVIGYEITEETEPGIFEEKTIENNYIGDVIKNSRRLQETGKVNDDITISNRISIIADPFANNNFHTMRYVEFMGAKWKIKEVEVEYPRLILTIGGLYNGQ
jgi:hypothetical protein